MIAPADRGNPSQYRVFDERIALTIPQESGSGGTA
jgi:hypothetical protein